MIEYQYSSVMSLAWIISSEWYILCGMIDTLLPTATRHVIIINTTQCIPLEKGAAVVVVVEYHV